MSEEAVENVIKESFVGPDWKDLVPWPVEGPGLPACVNAVLRV